MMFKFFVCFVIEILHQTTTSDTRSNLFVLLYISVSENPMVSPLPALPCDSGCGLTSHKSCPAQTVRRQGPPRAISLRIRSRAPEPITGVFPAGTALPPMPPGRGSVAVEWKGMGRRETFAVSDVDPVPIGYIIDYRCLIVSNVAQHVEQHELPDVSDRCIFLADMGVRIVCAAFSSLSNTLRCMV